VIEARWHVSKRDENPLQEGWPLFGWIVYPVGGINRMMCRHDRVTRQVSGEEIRIAVSNGQEILAVYDGDIPNR